MTTDTRLGMLEGRADEQAEAIADLRVGQREIVSTMNSRFEEVNRRFEEVNRRFEEVNSRIDRLNSRIDRLFLAMLGIGAAQVALLITLVVRG